jgi:hypothetical protein
MKKQEDEKKELKIKINLEENLDSPNLSRISSSKKVYWKSCCFLLDKRAVQFFSQLFLSLIIMSFCIYQLIVLDKCDSAEYLSLLTLVLGVYVPTPKINTN